MAGAFYQQVAYRIRAAVTVDRYGNEVRDWGSATRTVMPGINIQPLAGDEMTGDRSALTRRLRLISWRGMTLDLLPTDRVEVGGVAHEVDGPIGFFVSYGRLHHEEAELKVVTG